MGDAVSPLRRVATTSYLKVWQSLKCAFSLLKLIRTPLAEGSGNIVETVNDDCWLFSSGLGGLSFAAFFLEGPYNFGGVTLFVILCSLACIHVHLMFSVCYWHREMSPFRLMGAKAKFMIQVIPVIVAALLDQLVEYNFGCFVIIQGITIYFYSIAHFMHVAYDIGEIDVFLGLGMLHLVHWFNQELLTVIEALSFCLCISLVRYMTYRAPQLPIHSKKELEESPV